MPHASLQGLSPLEIAKPKTNIVEERKLLRPFGEPVYAHTYTENKLAERAVEARIVGFTPTHGTYNILLPNRRVTTAKNPMTRLTNQPTIDITISSPIQTMEEDEEAISQETKNQLSSRHPSCRLHQGNNLQNGRHQGPCHGTRKDWVFQELSPAAPVWRKLPICLTPLHGQTKGPIHGSGLTRTQNTHLVGHDHMRKRRS